MTQVMHWDGTTRSGPSAMPTRAVKLADGRTVSRLTADMLPAPPYYAVQRATPSDGNEVVSSTWELVDGVFVESITEQPRGTAWAAANAKHPEDLQMEEQLKAVLDGLNIEYPIQEGTLPTIIARAEQWIAAAPNADVKGDRRQTLLKVVALWTKLGQAVYTQHFGRQPTPEDAP